MRTIIKLTSIATAITLTVGALALAAPRSQRANKYFTVAGNVLQINKHDRTLLVADRFSEKFYLIDVPEGAAFTIIYGRSKQMREPGLEDLSVRDRIEIRCLRSDSEHLALIDGRLVIKVTAAI